MRKCIFKTTLILSSLSLLSLKIMTIDAALMDDVTSNKAMTLDRKLIEAAKSNNTQAIAEALKNNPNSKSIVNKLLYYATTPDMINYLIVYRGADVNNKELGGVTPLENAINPDKVIQDISVIEGFLDHEASTGNARSRVQQLLQQLDKPETRQSKAFLIEKLKNVIEVFSNHQRIKDLIRQNPATAGTALYQAADIGLIDFASRILGSHPQGSFSDGDLEMLASRAQEHYEKTQDKTYQELQKLLLNSRQNAPREKVFSDFLADMAKMYSDKR